MSSLGRPTLKKKKKKISCNPKIKYNYSYYISGVLLTSKTLYSLSLISAVRVGVWDLPPFSRLFKGIILIQELWYLIGYFILHFWIKFVST